jgi:hypothetical protein
MNRRCENNEEEKNIAYPKRGGHDMQPKIEELE